MPSFTAGVVKFQQSVFPEKKALFERLSKDQSPEALFITCSDSRIDTGLFTQTDPGELFVLRNAGNIVPPHSEVHAPCSAAAAIEFAVMELNVPHVVICGHTPCGAMEGAMDTASLERLPCMHNWVAHSRAAVDAANSIHANTEGATEEDRKRIVVQQNVILQLRNLQTHPAVVARLARKDLSLHGWVYDIKTGAVDVYDESRGVFISFTERYSELRASR